MIFLRKLKNIFYKILKEKLEWKTIYQNQDKLAYRFDYHLVSDVSNPFLHI